MSIFLFSALPQATEVDPFSFVPSSLDLSAIQNCMFTSLKNFASMFLQEKVELTDFHVFHDFHEEVKKFFNKFTPLHIFNFY